jgi:hypothetical protein
MRVSQAKPHPNSLLGERTAADALDRTSFDRIGNRPASVLACRVEMDGKDEIPALILFDTHAADARLLEELRGMSTLDFLYLFFGGHRLVLYYDFQAKATLRPWRTSPRWLAIVWLVEPAKSNPIALFVPRSRINDPESPPR